MEGRGGGLRRQLSVATRRELIEAVATRYRAAARESKKEILDEFVKVTGFHRASSGKFVGDGERQRAVSVRNRRSFRQVESNDLC
jgi:hypothetical protein